MTTIAGLVLFITFFIFLIIGLPIALAIILSSIITLLLILPFDVTIVTAAQRMVTGIDDFTMLAIPLFVLAGIIMNNGGIAFRLVNFAKVLVGRLPGSLAHTNIVGNMLFGSISGSSVAAAAAMGRIMGPMEKTQGYKKRILCSSKYRISTFRFTHPTKFTTDCLFISQRRDIHCSTIYRGLYSRDFMGYCVYDRCLCNGEKTRV